MFPMGKTRFCLHFTHKKRSSSVNNNFRNLFAFLTLSFTILWCSVICRFDVNQFQNKFLLQSNCLTLFDECSNWNIYINDSRNLAKILNQKSKIIYEVDFYLSSFNQKSAVIQSKICSYSIESRK